MQKDMQTREKQKTKTKIERIDGRFAVPKTLKSESITMTEVISMHDAEMIDLPRNSHLLSPRTNRFMKSDENGVLRGMDMWTARPPTSFPSNSSPINPSSSHEAHIFLRLGKGNNGDELALTELVPTDIKCHPPQL